MEVHLAKIRKLPGYGYGLKVPMAWLEKHLRAKRKTQEFALEMMALRAEMEDEDGYYFQSQTQRDESGKRVMFFQIPDAIGHEEVSTGFECKLRKYAHRAVDLRARTLSNPDAVLDDDQRRRMDKNLEIAGMRLALLSRERKVMQFLEAEKPELMRRNP